MRLVLIVAVVALAGCGSPSSELVGVPDVRGMRHSEAVCALVDAGLRWRDRGDRHAGDRAPVCDRRSAAAPDPPILRQRPPTGRDVRAGPWWSSRPRGCTGPACRRSVP